MPTCNLNLGTIMHRVCVVHGSVRGGNDIHVRLDTTHWVFEWHTI